MAPWTQPGLPGAAWTLSPLSPLALAFVRPAPPLGGSQTQHGAPPPPCFIYSTGHPATCPMAHSSTMATVLSRQTPSGTLCVCVWSAVVPALPQ